MVLITFFELHDMPPCYDISSEYISRAIIEAVPDAKRRMTLTDWL